MARVRWLRPPPPASGWPAGRIARGYAGFGLTPGMGLVVFGTSIDGSLWYGDLPALDGARDQTHSLSTPRRARRRPNIPNAPVDGSVLDALRLTVMVCLACRSVVCARTGALVARVDVSVAHPGSPVSQDSACRACGVA